MINIKFWIWQVLLALDQLANAIAGGYADETLSSRAYRMSLRYDSEFFGWRWRLCAVLINALFFDAGHCHDAFKSERSRKHLPPEMRIKG